MRNSFAVFTLSLLIILFVSDWACAQRQDSTNTITNFKKNAVFVELLGGPQAYSLNYQRLARTRTKFVTTYRISVSSLIRYNYAAAHVGGLVGSGKNALDFSLGLGYANEKDKEQANFVGDGPQKNFLYLTPQAGYRYQHPTNGFLFRANLTPWFQISPSVEKLRFTPGIGLSFGKAF